MGRAILTRHNKTKHYNKLPRYEEVVSVPSPIGEIGSGDCCYARTNVPIPSQRGRFDMVLPVAYAGIVRRFAAAAGPISIIHRPEASPLSLQVNPRRLTIVGKKNEMPYTTQVAPHATWHGSAWISSNFGQV